MNKNPLTDDAILILTRIGMQSDDMQKRNMNLARDVTRAREAGCSWAMIGMSLGTTSQAAWQKYRPIRALHARQEELDLVDVPLPGMDPSGPPEHTLAPGEEEPPPQNAALRGARPGPTKPHAGEADHEPGQGNHRTIDAYEACPACGGGNFLTHVGSEE